MHAPVHNIGVQRRPHELHHVGDVVLVRDRHRLFAQPLTHVLVFICASALARALAVPGSDPKRR